MTNNEPDTLDPVWAAVFIVALTLALWLGIALLVRWLAG